MTTKTADTSVRTSIVVEAPVDRAFSVFTEDIGSWWPPTHHILQSELKEMVFEPRVGGQVYDRGVDGSECCWARVLAFDPPNRFVISWDISLQWQIETDPVKTSEVEVRFVSDCPNQTGRTRAPPHRPSRRGMGANAQRGWLPGRLGGRPAPIRRASHPLTAWTGKTARFFVPEFGHKPKLGTKKAGPRLPYGMLAYREEDHGEAARRTRCETPPRSSAARSYRVRAHS